MPADDQAPPRDRHAYLEEQIQRQKRGEPIDTEWVRGELERVRREQMEMQARTQRKLFWLSMGSAVVLLLLWIRSGGFAQRTGPMVLGLILAAALAAWALARRGQR